MNPLLEIGARNDLHVRHERVRANGRGAPYRILYASDLHFLNGRSTRVAEQISAAVSETRPDVVLLGGDLVDLPVGLEILGHFVRRVTETSPVWAIRGNHDIVVSRPTLQQSLEAAGGHLLEEQSLRITEKKGMTIKIDGRLAPTSPLLESTDFPVLCAHNPALFPTASKLYYSLVLAGHLHGCQCVLWEKNQRLFPGAWIYKWNGLRFHESKTTMIVSRGASDTLPIRWNCPREVILCELY